MNNGLDKSDFRLGQLMVNFGVASNDDIERGAKLSSLTTLPLGRTLVMLEYVPELIVRSVVEAQSMLRDRLITVDQAREAVSIVKRKQWTFADALVSMGVDSSATRGSRLGELLSDSERIDKRQLDLGLMLSDSSGLPLGQIFLLMNRITEEFLRFTLALQRELRAGRFNRNKVIERLKKASSADETSTNLPPATGELDFRIKLGELLVMAGITDKARMEKAVESSRLEGRLLGEYLVDEGVISTEVLSLSLRLQSMLWSSQITLQKASDVLSQVSRHDTIPSEFLKECGLPTEQEKSITLYDFLRLSGYLTAHRLKIALTKIMDQPRLMTMILKYADSTGEISGQQLKAATKKAFLDSSTLRFVLAEAFPYDRAIVDAALVFHQLVQGGKMNLRQALFNFSVKQSGINDINVTNHASH